jgi:hypothetical protein
MNNPALHITRAAPQADHPKDQAAINANSDQIVVNSEMAIRFEILSLTDQLLTLLENKFSAENPEIQHALGFLRYYLQYYLNDQPIALHGNSAWHQQSKQPSGLSRLIHGLKLSTTEIQMLVLAGMAQEHEGFADIFRSLHPTRQPYPTAALLSQIVSASESQRSVLAQCLTASPLINAGVVSLSDDAPILACSMKVSAIDWQAIKSAVAQPNLLNAVIFESCNIGLDKWLNSSKIKQARHCITQNLPSILYLQNPDLEVAINRAYVLVQREHKKLFAVTVGPKTEPKALVQLGLHCLLSGSIPLLVIESSEIPTTIEFSHLARFCQCIVIGSNIGIALNQHQLMTLDLPTERLDVASLVGMWCQLLPELTEQAQQLANRFSLEPSQALRRIRTFKTLNTEPNEPLTLDAFIAGLKQHNNEVLPQGIKRISPRLGWQDLVLPDIQRRQLQEAIQRLVLQHKVLDDWQFLHNRRGVKGVRLLFSGAPGTGKTISAEVLANALQVDLLIVDLAAVVSKWIGETEKNLAKVFSFAEQSQALLFFDEADAIFGKRTEVSDSHDRYANLETAYLLTRLEAYEGMAILATNFRNNIDAAFIRRLDHIIDFREPNHTDRERLWRCHVPDRAPLSDNVDFAQLAALFPMVGGEIRNAAVAAAYLAAGQQQSIQQDHFITAIRTEYEKTGKAFREVNPF